MEPMTQIVQTDGYLRIKEVSLNFVRAMKIGTAPGVYCKEVGEGESLYGSYHAAHILDLFGELDNISERDRDQWADIFRKKQTGTGFFTNRAGFENTILNPEELDPFWHSTRGNLWALRILDRAPHRPLDFIEPLMDAKALYRWVKSYDWKNSWAAGNQILACATALLAQRDWFGADDVDHVMEHGMYPALEELIDEHTGFWGTQYGSDLPSGLFGTIHVTPIYFRQKWPLRAVERNVDSTLKCQLSDGSFWPGGSDCPDFDGAYMMANLAELTDYRREDLQHAARRYLEHALMHESPDACGWLLHRRDSRPEDWVPRPHFLWKPGRQLVTELRDDDPARTHIMLGSWFYPLSIALIAHMLGDTGYEGPYRMNAMSLHQSNVFE
ncbi:MAG: hypothetical protein JXM70_28055 [Pirellulales bacterium]|nr:hypothetical protein [Pirellulales bacterium]